MRIELNNNEYNSYLKIRMIFQSVYISGKPSHEAEVLGIPPLELPTTTYLCAGRESKSPRVLVLYPLILLID